MSMIGKTLGTFECTALLGKGGMGEVYRAKDQKLGRDVAIKVLPEEFAKDADRVARFQREAKLLASLNHNNIASIYGLEESDGTHFLVLELIEGDTLADRLKRGAIPVEESLKLALQIAEALEAAHEKGVIHRDLKPANIKVTPDGKVKVLDFGLAKAFGGDSEDINLSNSPTLSVAATQQGIILGTAAYMSPEQASGETVDRRTDIWAFGVVLFEMLTGRSLFEGNNVSQTLASVIKSEPQWQSLPPNLHPRIRLLLERCLEKESANRYSGISDARVDIQKVLSDPSGVFSQSSVMAKPRKKMRVGIPWVAAAVALAGVAVWILKPAPTPEPKRIIRLDYHLPDDQQFQRTFLGGPPPITVSPDGSHFVYCTPEGFYMRSIDQFNATHIAGTDGNSSRPFFSPDGNSLGYRDTEEDKLKKVSISGGAPISLCDAQTILGASWNEDDTIIYGTFDQGIRRVSANGGTPETIIETEHGILSAPQILPDGKPVLFSRIQNNVGMISIHSLESGETRELFEGYDPKYLPTGHLVYVLDNNLLAVPFDIETGEATGRLDSMIEGVGPFSVSNEGTLFYIPVTAVTSEPSITLVWIDRKGEAEPITEIPGNYLDLKVSLDGTRVAMARATDGENVDIWIWDLFRKTMSRLTFDEVLDDVPIWTPDSQRILYCLRRSENRGIYMKTADGTGKVEQLISEPEKTIFPCSWADEGKILLFYGFSQNSQQSDIEMFSMEGNQERELLLNEEYSEAYPQVSPDGRWLAYQSNESGQEEVYVRPFPDVESKRWPISNNGGDSPLWSPDGQELFYRSGDAVVAVAVETEPTFKPGNPETLFRGPFFSYQNVGMRFTVWDISPDGKRFITGRRPAQIDDESTEAGFPRKINIVLNWFEELKERVPKE